MHTMQLVPELRFSSLSLRTEVTRLTSGAFILSDVVSLFGNPIIIGCLKSEVVIVCQVFERTWAHSCFLACFRRAEIVVEAISQRIVVFKTFLFVIYPPALSPKLIM